MNKRRLFSSKEVIAAFERAGFQLAQKTKGSHQALKRKRDDGQHDVVIVVLGKKEIPERTFMSMLKQANMSHDEFLHWAKVKEKGK